MHWHFTKATACNTVSHCGRKKGFDRFSSSFSKTFGESKNETYCNFLSKATTCVRLSKTIELCAVKKSSGLTIIASLWHMLLLDNFYKHMN